MQKKYKTTISNVITAVITVRDERGSRWQQVGGRKEQ
jgi:hypothetical protein